MVEQLFLAVPWGCLRFVIVVFPYHTHYVLKCFMRDPVKTYFDLLKIQVKFKINLKLEISMRPVCPLMIFLLFTLRYLII